MPADERPRDDGEKQEDPSAVLVFDDLEGVADPSPGPPELLIADEFLLSIGSIENEVGARIIALLVSGSATSVTDAAHQVGMHHATAYKHVLALPLIHDLVERYHINDRLGKRRRFTPIAVQLHAG